MPLPLSRPASRVNTVGSPWTGNVRAHAKRVGSDLSSDYGKPHYQRASSAGVFGQGQNHLVDNRPSSTATSGSTQIRDVGSAPILDPLKRTDRGVWWNKLQIVEQRPNPFYLILLQQSLSSADLRSNTSAPVHPEISLALRARIPRLG